MMNYQKNAKQWDKYEQTVQNYFEQQEIIKYGSLDLVEKEEIKKYNK